MKERGKGEGGRGRDEEMRRLTKKKGDKIVTLEADGRPVCSYISYIPARETTDRQLDRNRQKLTDRARGSFSERAPIQGWQGWGRRNKTKTGDGNGVQYGVRGWTMESGEDYGELVSLLAEK